MTRCWCRSRGFWQGHHAADCVHNSLPTAETVERTPPCSRGRWPSAGAYLNPVAVAWRDYLRQRELYRVGRMRGAR
jgi:hypothetical protein